MANTGHPRNAVQSHHHFGGLACISFETNSTSAPDGLVDPGNIATGVTRSAAGIYVVALRDRYRRVRATANYTEIPDYAANEAFHAHVTATVDGGTSANTVTLRVADPNGVAVDSNNKTLDVWIWTDSRYVT